MKKYFTLLPLLLLGALAARAQRSSYAAIYSGVPWFDDRGREVSAHGAGIVREQGRYYLFGEQHADNTNAFAGISCYSSADLRNWKFERLALPVQPTGKLGPGRVGERPKVMRCPKTGEYVLYLHVDTLGYTNQFVGYATASTITGPYTFRGPLLFNGRPIKLWDMGTFQDQDGAGYVLLHGGNIYQLSDDYRSVTRQVLRNMTGGFESPTLFRRGSLYYFLGSHLTGWERNDNYYFTATNLAGPWTARGTFAPAGTLTWNSQTTFVLPVAGTKDTTYVFMGDRWSYPYQASAATYVWQPLTVRGPALALAAFQPAWQVNPTTGVATADMPVGQFLARADQLVRLTGTWQPDTLGGHRTSEAGAKLAVAFTGRQIGFYASSRVSGGYARVVLTNQRGQAVLATIVDMYSKYPAHALKFLSPRLPKGQYTLTLQALGEHWKWVDKAGTITGSQGNAVFIDQIIMSN